MDSSGFRDRTCCLTRLGHSVQMIYNSTVTALQVLLSDLFRAILHLLFGPRCENVVSGLSLALLASDSSDNASSWLPEDCLLHVFSFVSLVDVRRCRGVCRRWKEVVDLHPEVVQVASLTVQHASEPHKRATFSKLQQTASVRRLVDGLVSSKYKIRHAKINFSVLTKDLFEILGYFLSSACCVNLKTLSVAWCGQQSAKQDCDLAYYRSLETDAFYYLCILDVVRTLCPVMRSLRTQFNWSRNSVSYLTKFESLQHLDIRCVPRVHCIQKWHLDEVFARLTNLKTFKLEVTILPENVQKFAVVSDTLESLVVSCCRNLLLTSMTLPSLRRFTAEEFSVSSKVLGFHGFCLYEVLREGCPKLATINGLQCNRHGSKETFVIPDSLQSACKICFCEEHLPHCMRTTRANVAVIPPAI